MPMKTIEGYSKEKYTDTSVLLAGGGAKALSGFIGSLSWDSTNKKIKYTPANGGSETDLVTLNWENISGKPINFKAYSGSLASGGWKIMQGNNSSPSIAISYNNNSAAWNSETYSATLVYGCSDTRGLLDCAYSTPKVTFGGCSYGGSSDDNPTWYMTLSGTNRTTYNLDSMPYASSAGNADTIDSQHLMTQVSNWNTDSLSIFKSSENSVSNAPTTDFTYGVTLRFHRDYSTYHTDLVTSLYHDRLFFRRKADGGY